MTAVADAAIALGSNLGDRSVMIESASRAIATTAGVHLLARAPVIETEAVGSPGVEPGGPYLNSAVTVRTSLSPEALLAELHRIERALGRNRVRENRWAARTIDLDLLLYADRTIAREGIIVPHPRLAERLFVLEPLAAVAPEWIVPTLGRTVSELLQELRARTRVK